jgi:hypothetical protein
MRDQLLHARDAPDPSQHQVIHVEVVIGGDNGASISARGV